jgi:hypothetical protein
MGRLQAEYQFIPLIPPRHSLILPQDLGRPGGELRINHSRLPIVAAMRLQAGLGQDPGIGRIVNCTPDGPFYDHLLEKETGKGPFSCLLTSPGPLFYTTESS